MMNRALLLFVAALGLAASDGALAAPQAHSTRCETLTALTAPDIRITAASRIPAGAFKVADDQAPADVPAFCRVQGVATPTTDSHIEFEVWIPTTTWNGKYQAVGVGGYMGSISYSAMVTALKRGYAVQGNDTGHKGGDLSFGLGHPEKVTDWAWRAMHVSAQAGKLVIRNATGIWPSYSYFVGCSSGGHQALSEVQRFPDDFDGVIAGDPGYNRVRQTAAYLWSWLMLHDEHGKSLLSENDLQLLTRSAVAECGDKDGVIQEPRSCGFDPASLLCQRGKTMACLSQPQIDAVKKVYAGARNPRTGEQIYAGWTVGSEAGWSNFLTAPAAPMRNEVFGYFLFNNPSWDFRSFDFDHDLTYAESKIGHMAAINPDLAPFKASDGKLIMYTGWMDPVAPPEDASAYYESVVAKMGGGDELSPFFRFFMVPGMAHCGGGLGATEFDMLTALEAWVEKGEAPQTILATRKQDEAIVRTRPLCPYPNVARYSGRGDHTIASSYVCAAPSPRSEAYQRK